MKKLGHIGLFLISGILGILSCAEDELELEQSPILTTVKFINQDSIVKLNQQIAVLNSTINAIDARISAIDALADRTPFLAEKDSLNLEKANLIKQRDEYNATKTLINTGSINLTILQAEGGKEPIFNSPIDSATNFIFPLDYNKTRSRFYATIKNKIDTIDFEYSLDTLYTEFKVSVNTSNLSVPFHSFDSVKVECLNSQCISNEATVTFYF